MPARKSYRPWMPEQACLLPPSPSDWLPEDHLARFVREVVEELDLSGIEAFLQSKDPRGNPPYDPRMMVALLLYAYSSGVCSSRRIEKKTYEDVAFRYLAAGQHPDFCTICTFRRTHLDALAGLFLQVLQLCREAGLVTLGHVSLDGTKIEANASKHKAMSYERMQKDMVRLQGEIRELLSHAEQADRKDDARLGSNNPESDLPEELRRREGRLQRIREAKAALEAQARRARIEALRKQAERARATAQCSEDPSERKRARTRAAKREKAARALGATEEDDSDEGPPTESADAMPSHRTPTTRQGVPKPKAQRNFTDPESRIMEHGGEIVQAFNGQIAVDAQAQVIVAHGLSNQSPDTHHLIPMMCRVKRNCGRRPDRMTADAGYWAPENASWCENAGIDAYISTSRRKHERDDNPVRGPPDGPRAKMQAKVSEEEGRRIYSRRKCIPEPVFGQIKGARGFRRFSMRGLRKVAGEWGFVCACHNLLKLRRARQRI